MPPPACCCHDEVDEVCLHGMGICMARLWFDQLVHHTRAPLEQVWILVLSVCHDLDGFDNVMRLSASLAESQ